MYYTDLSGNIIYGFTFRATVVVLIVISILWIPVLTASAGGQIFIYLNVVLTAIGPPVFALYLIGILWTRANETVRSNSGVLSLFVMDANAVYRNI